MKKQAEILFKWNTEKLASLKNRNTIFMWFSAITAFILLLVAIYYKNKLFALGIILASAMVYSIKKVEPKTFPVEITERGIQVYNRLFLYKKIQNFYIINHHNKNYLLFVAKQHAIFLTNILLIEPFVDIDELRNYLATHLKEENVDAEFLDMVFE